MKVARDSMCMHGCNCVSTQLNLHKQIQAHLGDAVGSVLVFASRSKVSFEVFFVVVVSQCT